MQENEIRSNPSRGLYVPELFTLVTSTGDVDHINPKHIGAVSAFECSNSDQHKCLSKIHYVVYMPYACIDITREEYIRLCSVFKLNMEATHKLEEKINAKSAVTQTRKPK